MPRFITSLACALGATACTTTYIAPPDPIPVIGAQVMSATGHCIDVRDGATVDGTPIVLVECHGSPNQRWFISHGQISESFGSCLDIQSGNVADGTPLLLVTCNGRASQQWTITNGEIISMSGKCVDSGSSTDDLTPLTLAECKATPAQLWTVQ